MKAPFTASMENATIRNRVDTIHQRLVAIEGTVRLLTLEQFSRPASNETIAEIALRDLYRCQDELTWLRNLPAAVLDQAAPTDDELAGVR